MGLLGRLKVVVSPEHAEFTQRLIAKRERLTNSSVMAGLAISGSPMYDLRQAGFGTVEYAVTPRRRLFASWRSTGKPIRSPLTLTLRCDCRSMLRQRRKRRSRPKAFKGILTALYIS